jgi:lipoprotein-releasing system permease protein
LSFSLYIAKRYLISKSKNSFINFITIFSALEIVLSTAALFVVLSVFSGLKEYSLSFTNSFDPDIKVSSTIGKTFICSSKQLQLLSQNKAVASFSKVVEERVLFTFDGKDKVAYLKGVDEHFQQTNSISKNLVEGNWLGKSTAQVVVGYGIANKLSLGLLDFNNRFEVLVPRKGKNVIESENDGFYKSVLIPSGIYAVNEDLDSKYVFCDIALARDLLELKANEVSAIEIKLKPNVDLASAQEEIAAIFNQGYDIKNREQQNATLYRMLNTENIAVYLIFTIVIIIALFNLFGTLIMMILEKKSNVKTLVYLGATLPQIRNIFFYQGVLISCVGGCIGLILGVVIVVLQLNYQLVMITETLAYPVLFKVENIVLAFLTISFLGLLASWIASRRVNKKLLV